MLRQIVDKKHIEIEQHKRERPIAALTKTIEIGSFAFSQALTARSWGLIAECKLASPVKGRLSDLSVGELAECYEANGAAVLSVLTDSHFTGNLSHLQAVKAVSRLPVLRKDFIIDEYQIYQARTVGADAILLIAAILTDQQIRRFLAVAKELGLDCLAEVHNREELARVQQTEASIVGINNRDLTTFTTSIEQTFALLPYCDSNRVIISESGINSCKDVRKLKAAGVRGALVGEGLVSADNIAQKVRELSLTETEEM